MVNPGRTGGSYQNNVMLCTFQMVLYVGMPTVRKWA